MSTTSVEQFWSKFLATDESVDRSTAYQTWYFGNSGPMARELADLVLAGKKTATASLKAVNDAEPEKAPIDDGYSVVTDFDGEPICVIRTMEIRHLPFKEVDAQFASDEGEGDQTLEYWRQVHWEYFVREAAEHEIAFDEDSIVCCERFALLFPK